MNSKVTLIIRLVVGAAMTFMGASKFFQSGPIEGMGGLTEIMTIMQEAGFLYVVGAIEAGAGLLLLFNKYVPLALTFLVGVLFNVVVFHILWQPEGIVLGLPLFILCLVLVYANKDRFNSLLSA